jgi:hypothetical protein
MPTAFVHLRIQVPPPPPFLGYRVNLYPPRFLLGAQYRGGSRGGGLRAPPLKLEKIWFFDVKSWFFTRNTPKFFAPPSARRNFFKCAPPNMISWIRPCNNIGAWEMGHMLLLKPYHWIWTELYGSLYYCLIKHCLKHHVCFYQATIPHELLKIVFFFFLYQMDIPHGVPYIIWVVTSILNL